MRFYDWQNLDLDILKLQLLFHRKMAKEELNSFFFKILSFMFGSQSG